MYPFLIRIPALTIDKSLMSAITSERAADIIPGPKFQEHLWEYMCNTVQIVEKVPGFENVNSACLCHGVC